MTILRAVEIESTPLPQIDAVWQRNFTQAVPPTAPQRLGFRIICRLFCSHYRAWVAELHTSEP